MILNSHVQKSYELSAEHFYYGNPVNYRRPNQEPCEREIKLVEHGCAEVLSL
jgi:hypothetical protein